MNATHLLNSGMPDMRTLYMREGCYATSTNADILLIRSHIAYWCGDRLAQQTSIKPSRGHSYRIAFYGKHDKHDTIIRITDHYDHREGVEGLK